MKLARTLAAVLLLAAIGFASYRAYCEYVALSNLEVMIIGASIKRVGLTSADLSLTLEIRNPTSCDSPAVSAVYDIYVGGAYVGRGSLPPTAIPAGEAVRRETIVTVEYAKAATGLAEALVRGRLQVTIRGKVSTRLLFGLIPITLSFERSYGG